MGFLLRSRSREEPSPECLPELGFAMADTPAITDRNLEATTNISLKREPACFAFLSPRSISPPMPIDSINLDLASADYFSGRASLWAALEMRSSVSDERPTAILGFDETFLRAFSKMAFVADQALHDLLEDMERLARQRKPVANT